MGELGRKKPRRTVFHILNADGEKITLYQIHVAHEPPSGVKVFANFTEALKSLKEKGKLPAQFDIDIGAFDLTKRGSQYKFRRDPKGKTKGDVSAKDAVVTLGRAR